MNYRVDKNAIADFVWEMDGQSACDDKEATKSC
jgi:hypothetical protein